MSDWKPMPLKDAPQHATWMDRPADCFVYSPKTGWRTGQAWIDPDGNLHGMIDGFHGDWGVTHFHPMPPNPAEQKGGE